MVIWVGLCATNRIPRHKANTYGRTPCYTWTSHHGNMPIVPACQMIGCRLVGKRPHIHKEGHGWRREALAGTADKSKQAAVRTQEGITLRTPTWNVHALRAMEWSVAEAPVCEKGSPGEYSSSSKQETIARAGGRTPSAQAHPPVSGEIPKVGPGNQYQSATQRAIADGVWPASGGPRTRETSPMKR